MFLWMKNTWITRLHQSPTVWLRQVVLGSISCNSSVVADCWDEERAKSKRKAFQTLTYAFGKDGKNKIADTSVWGWGVEPLLLRVEKKKSVKSVRVTPGRLPLKVIQLGGDPRVDPEHTRETGGIISSGFRNTSLSPERICKTLIREGCLDYTSLSLLPGKPALDEKSIRKMKGPALQTTKG